MAHATSPRSSRSTPRRTADAPSSSRTEERSLSDAPTVESPSLSTPSARARFEFEQGRGNEGTKILMVEWEDDASTRRISGKWTVSWEGKAHVLAAEERSERAADEQKDNDGEKEEEENEAGSEHRLFFLLPPGVSIPATVTLTLDPHASGGKKVVWRTNPLPAIFPPELANTAGIGIHRSKGVLHTLWAKKRLQTLSKEIDREASFNVEGVALEMALREKAWIEETFGIPSSRSGSNESSATSARRSLLAGQQEPRSPTTPLSPGGSRLSEKLRGLKLQTGDGDLHPRGSSREAGVLSPDDDDVAVPSYSAVSAKASALRAKPAQGPAQRRPKPQHPDPATRTRQQDSRGSLNGRISGGEDSSGMEEAEEEDEKDLFALPLSPRSPDMTKSPFTFAKRDTMKYTSGEKGSTAGSS